MNLSHISAIEYGSNGPIIILLTAHEPHHDLASLAARISTLTDAADFVLGSFEVQDWNRDYSPWPAAAAFGGADFAGEAPATLEHLLNNYLPQLRAQFPGDRPVFLLGYSLAGLFALWATFSTNTFDGAASCSGSLWFPKWDRYIETAVLTRPCNVYLSLGDKEEHTRNPIMATVGDRTRALAAALEQSEMIPHSILEINPGGHFKDPELRMAKGAAWFLQASLD